MKLTPSATKGTLGRKAYYAGQVIGVDPCDNTRNTVAKSPTCPALRFVIISWRFPACSTVGGATLTFDHNGNTTDQTGKALTYDAWNRLKSVTGASSSVTHSYDALGRRIKEVRTGPALTTDLFYSDKWQVVEEWKDGANHAQYLWSPVYVDAMILRDRNNDTNPDLEERVYVMQDANWNVTGIMNPAGSVLERYVYDPYGVPTRLTAGWQTPGADTYNWNYLHQGGRYDAASGLYQFRHRE